MTYFQNILIGSGMSSLVFYMNSKKKLKIISSNKRKIFKSKNFYENDMIGGNSNIWGGYINFKRHKKFLNVKEYKKIFNKKLFKTKKFLMINLCFQTLFTCGRKRSNF